MVAFKWGAKADGEAAGPVIDLKAWFQGFIATLEMCGIY
jgi:hypothetical protein